MLLTLSPNHAWQPFLFDKAGNSGRVDGQREHEQAKNQVNQGVRTPVAFFFLVMVVASRSRATSFVTEALLRLEYWESRVERLGGVCWDCITGVALVSRQAKKCHYLDEGEDSGEDG